MIHSYKYSNSNLHHKKNLHNYTNLQACYKPKFKKKISKIMNADIYIYVYFSSQVFILENVRTILLAGYIYIYLLRSNIYVCILLSQVFLPDNVLTILLAGGDEVVGGNGEGAATGEAGKSGEGGEGVEHLVVAGEAKLVVETRGEVEAFLYI